MAQFGKVLTGRLQQILQVTAKQPLLVNQSKRLYSVSGKTLIFLWSTSLSDLDNLKYASHLLII